MRTRWRTLTVVAILSSPALVCAQDQPDFSGVFIRQVMTGVLIFEPRQTLGSLEITEVQNGQSATRSVSIGSAPKRNELMPGLVTKESARYKQGKLVIKTSVVSSPVAEPHSHLGFHSSAPFMPSAGSEIKETWSLSKDSKTLEVRKEVKSKSGEVEFNDTEKYIRVPSLENAKQIARDVSDPTRCTRYSSPSIFQDGKSVPPYEGDLRYQDDALLGAQSIGKLTQCVRFAADLSGDFLKGLRRVKAGTAFEFKRVNANVSGYDDSVTLEVEPFQGETNPYFPDCWPFGPARNPELLDLRFSARWVGQVERDLGEVKAELMTEPFTELSTPNRFCRMHLDSKGIPLSDELEIHIYSGNREELACIRNHI